MISVARAPAGDGPRADGLELGVVGGRPRDVVDRPRAGHAAALRAGRRSAAPRGARRRAGVQSAPPSWAKPIASSSAVAARRGATRRRARRGSPAARARRGCPARGRPAARRRRRRPAARGAGPRSPRTPARRPRCARWRRRRRPGGRPRSRAPRRTPTRHWMVWTMPSPACPQRRAGELEEGQDRARASPRSSPKYRW